MAEPLLTFAHISDTHLHADPTYTGDFVDFSSRTHVLAVIEQINALPFKVDFVLHTGDIMTDPESPEDYGVARELLGRLNVPVRYLSGNHDRSPAVIAQFGVTTADPAKQRLYYEFDVNGVQFVCLDSTKPGGAVGLIDEAQLDWLSKICDTPDFRPLVAAVHHHPLPVDAPWLDTITLENGLDLHHTLLKAKTRLRAVFYGHIHENVCTLRDNIPYFSTLSGWFQTRTWYGQTRPFNDPTHMPGYNLVTLTAQDTFIRGYRVPVGTYS